MGTISHPDRDVIAIDYGKVIDGSDNADVGTGLFFISYVDIKGRELGLEKTTSYNEAVLRAEPCPSRLR